MIRTGDVITLDVAARSLDVAVTPEEFAERTKTIYPAKLKLPTGAM
jgi:dihydroxyacid dehydratase/phosphogluconate dehydratase